MPLKKPFLYGLRGKARRRKNLVFLCAFFVAVIYIEVGELNWSIEVASEVQSFWKYIVFLLMIASFWYSDWRIHRRVIDPTLPPLSLPWYLWDGIIAFAFAVVSADQRVLFHVCTIVTILFLCGSERYYRRKLARVRKAERGPPVSRQTV